MNVVSVAHDIARDLRVQITHGTHLLNLHATIDQLLLHRHDFGGIGVAHHVAQLLRTASGALPECRCWMISFSNEIRCVRLPKHGDLGNRDVCCFEQGSN